MESKKYTEYVLLELIASSSKFLEEYCTLHPTQDVNARLFSADTSCSCRSDIIEFYNNNKDTINAFITKFISKNPNEINLKQLISRIESKYIGGQTFRIKSTDVDFSNFVSKLNNDGLIFRSVSVIKDDDTLILLFF